MRKKGEKSQTPIFGMKEVNYKSCKYSKKIKEYYDQLHANKLGNSQKMDKLLTRNEILLRKK